MKMIRKNRGLTLIELMISLVLGLVLSAAAVSIFISNKQTFKLQEAVANVQENGRFAMNVLLTNIRSAGATFVSGTSLDVLEVQNMIEGEPDFSLGTGIGAPALIGFNADDNSTTEGFDLAAAASGASAVGWTQGDVDINTDMDATNDTDAVPDDLPDELFSITYPPLLGRDVILIDTGDGSDSCGGAIGVFNANNVHAGAEETTTPPFCGLSVCDVVVIVNDGYASIFMVTDLSNNPPNSSQTDVDATWDMKGQKNKKHADDGSVCPYENYTQTFDWDLDGGSLYLPQESGYSYFYIEGNSTDRTSLWKAEGPDFASPQELVEGVYDMQLTYFQDIDGDGQITKTGDLVSGSFNGFVDASQITDWSEVIATKIELLMESDQSVLDSEQSYEFNGSTLMSPETDDFRLKKSFSLTVAIRNKVL